MSTTTDLPTLLSEIRARRETNTTQATQLLALADAAPDITDTETRLASLRMAARQLTDDAVCVAWCASIPGEKNPTIRHTKIARLAQHLNGPRVRPAHYTAAIPLIPALLAATADDALRLPALALLATLVEHTPEAGAALATAYEQTRDRELRHGIINALAPLRYNWPGIIPFLQKILPDLDASLQPHIVAFLLTRNALDEPTQLSLLSPGAAPTTRAAILAHWTDTAGSSSTGSGGMGDTPMGSSGAGDSPVDGAAAPSAIADALIRILRTDPDRNVRAQALRLLELRTDILPAAERTDLLLEILRRDTEPAFRETAARALARTTGANAAVTYKYLAALATETDANNFARILALLAPNTPANTPEGEKIRAALLAQLDTNLQSPLAALITKTLQESILRNPAIAAHLLARFETARDDRVAATLLDTLARIPAPAISLTTTAAQPATASQTTPPSSAANNNADLFTRAAKSPSAAIRSSALLGLAALPLTPANTPALISAVALINDNAILSDTRDRFARKLAHIPPATLTPETQTALKTIVAGLPAGGDTRLALETLLTKAATAPTTSSTSSASTVAANSAASTSAASAPASGTPAPDFAEWRNRLHNEKRTDGMLPALYLCYDKYPVESAALLREIVKTPDHTANIHNNEFHRDATILDFLRTRGAIDDEMSQLCATFLLGKDESWGNLDFHLALLKSNLAWPRLWTTLWEILDRNFIGTPPNDTLLREVMFLSAARTHGTPDKADAAIADEFTRRATAITSPQQLSAYLRFLEKNAYWDEAIPVLREIEAKLPPALLAEEKTQKLISKIYERQGTPRTPFTPPPVANAAPQSSGASTPAPAAPKPPARTDGGLLDE